MMNCSSVNEEGEASKSSSCPVPKCCSDVILKGPPPPPNPPKQCWSSGVAECVLAVLENLPCEVPNVSHEGFRHKKRPHPATPYPTWSGKDDEDTDSDEGCHEAVGEPKTDKDGKDEVKVKPKCGASEGRKTFANDTLHGSDYHLYEEILYETNNNEDTKDKKSNSPPPLPVRPPNLLKPSTLNGTSSTTLQHRLELHVQAMPHPRTKQQSHIERTHLPFMPMPYVLQRRSLDGGAHFCSKDLNEHVQWVFQRHLQHLNTPQNFSMPCNKQQKPQLSEHKKKDFSKSQTQISKQTDCNQNSLPPPPPIRTTSVGHNTEKSSSLSCLVISNSRTSISPPSQTSCNISQQPRPCPPPPPPSKPCPPKSKPCPQSIPCAPQSKLPPPPPKPPKPPRLSVMASYKPSSQPEGGSLLSNEKKRQSICSVAEKDRISNKEASIGTSMENLVHREDFTCAEDTSENLSSSSSKPKQRNNLYSIFKERQHRRFLSASLELEYHNHTELSTQPSETKTNKDKKVELKPLNNNNTSKKDIASKAPHPIPLNDVNSTALSSACASAVILSSSTDDDYGFKVLAHVV